MTKHTLGPWEKLEAEVVPSPHHSTTAVGDNINAVTLVAIGSGYSAGVAEVHGSFTSDERRANARLIAAAPVMYALLEEAFDLLVNPTLNPDSEENADLAEAIREVLEGVHRAYSA